jgi:hypothetical protein
MLTMYKRNVQVKIGKVLVVYYIKSHRKFDTLKASRTYQRETSEILINLSLGFHLCDSSLVTATIAVVLRSSRSTSDALVAHIPIHGEVLERTALGLGDEEGGENTREHESRENLHDMVEPWVRVGCGGVATNAKWRDSTLRDDRTNLSGGGRDTVGC